MEDESPAKKYRSLAEIMRVTIPYPLPSNVDGASIENCPRFKAVGIGEKLKGVGKPYAPENWPNRGDNWSWGTGRRILPSGYYMDRYLYPPQHLPDARRRRRVLDSKKEVENYVISTFPGRDVDAFFKSFSWRIPSHQIGGTQFTETVLNAPPEVNVPASCKAGNGTCSSLAESKADSSRLMPCNACSPEPWFCRHCTCLFCDKTVSSDHQGFDHIKCETLVDGLICGHVAHVRCALRASMAGTVGGSVDLDAEYKCRRCDSKTDLVPHAEKILKIYESMNSSDENVNVVLTLGISVMRHSTRLRAQQLFHQLRVHLGLE